MATIWYHDFKNLDVILGWKIPTPQEVKTYYEKVAEVEDDDLETLFIKFQDDPNRTIRSMSVGDVVEVEGIFHLCRPVGWEAIGFNPEERK